MGLDFDVRRDFRMAFATPILQTKMSEAAEINPGLRRAILDRETAEPGSSRSNVCGWHSRGDFLTWDVPEIAPLAAERAELAHTPEVVTVGRSTVILSPSLRPMAGDLIDRIEIRRR